jgi:hypothetical protein
MSDALDYVSNNCGMAGEQVAQMVGDLESQLAALRNDYLSAERRLTKSLQRSRDLSDQLAASQAREQQLREALESVKAQQIDGYMFPAVVDMSAWHTKVINALSIPYDTSALDQLKVGYELQIKTLREALDLLYDHCRLYHPAVEENNVGEAVRKALSIPSAHPQPKPVAWMFKGGMPIIQFQMLEGQNPSKWEPLYTKESL